MRLSRIHVLVSLLALVAPAVAGAETPKPGTKKYLAEEAVQRIGFDVLAAVYTVVSPAGMIEGAIARDIPYAPVRKWGEDMMSRSMVASGKTEQALAVGLTGRGPADPNDFHPVVDVKWNVGPDAGRLKRFGIIAGSRVAAGVLGAVYTVVSPVTTIVGSIAEHVPNETVKHWGEDAISQGEMGAKVAQNLLAMAISGKMVDDPMEKYPLGSYAFGWDDGRTAPTKTTPAATSSGSGSSTSTTTPPQRPPVGIAPGTHVSLPGGNGGFHH